MISDPGASRRPAKPRREDLAPGECLCDHCTGKCCRYYSLNIDTPTTWDDFDRFHDYLAQGRTLIYLEKGTWYLVIMTRCKYLAGDNRCLIYLSRPKICNEYTTADCEYDDDWVFETVFETAEQIREYAEAILPPRRVPRVDSISPGMAAETESFFTVRIDTPTTWDDYDAVRWYLAHGRCLVFLEKGRWFLVVLSRCEFLEPTDRERILQNLSGNRPDARAIKSEYDGDQVFETVFETPEQLWEYAEATLPPRRRPRKPTGSELIVLSSPG